MSIVWGASIDILDCDQCWREGNVSTVRGASIDILDCDQCRREGNVSIGRRASIKFLTAPPVPEKKKRI